jgi:hypothetical protein
VLDQPAPARVMVGARARRAPETFAMFANECFAERAQTGITERAGPFADVFPIRRLLRAQLRRPLQKLAPLLAIQVTHLPIPRVEPELLMLHELADQLDEIGRLQCAAGAKLRMIAPDPQRHAVAGVRQPQLAIRLFFARDLRRDAFHLDMDARFHRRAVLRMPSNFGKSQKVHHR